MATLRLCEWKLWNEQTVKNGYLTVNYYTSKILLDDKRLNLNNVYFCLEIAMVLKPPQNVCKISYLWCHILPFIKEVGININKEVDA